MTFGPSRCVHCYSVIELVVPFLFTEHLKNPIKETEKTGGGDLGMSFEDPIAPIIVHGHWVCSVTISSFPVSQRPCRKCEGHKLCCHPRDPEDGQA